MTPCSVDDLPHADRLGPALTRALDALIEMVDIIPSAQVKISEQDAIYFECTGGRPPPSFWDIAIDVVDAAWPSKRPTG